jgi:hypothetical protein
MAYSVQHDLGESKIMPYAVQHDPLVVEYQPAHVRSGQLTFRVQFQ